MNFHTKTLVKHRVDFSEWPAGLELVSPSSMTINPLWTVHKLCFSKPPGLTFVKLSEAELDALRQEEADAKVDGGPIKDVRFQVKPRKEKGKKRARSESFSPAEKENKRPNLVVIPEERGHAEVTSTGLGKAASIAAPALRLVLQEIDINADQPLALVNDVDVSLSYGWNANAGPSASFGDIVRTGMDTTATSDFVSYGGGASHALGLGIDDAMFPIEHFGWSIPAPEPDVDIAALLSEYDFTGAASAFGDFNVGNM